MAHLIKLELKKFGTARNIIFTFAAILVNDRNGLKTKSCVKTIGVQRK